MHVPLFFRFGHVVFGRGFVADVRFLGRATCTREFDSVWMYGVNPSALAAEGDTLQSIPPAPTRSPGAHDEPARYRNPERQLRSR